jgi:hypothetical protein
VVRDVTTRRAHEYEPALCPVIIIFIINFSSKKRHEINAYSIFENNKRISTKYGVMGGGVIRGCFKKFPYWPPGARTANGTALCH